jgi:hypothetical protein
MIDQVELDLRSVLLPVRDQGPRPTCLAHAVSAAHEHARRTGSYLSPEYLHFFSDPTDSSCARSVVQVAKALQHDGQAEEATCPYLPAGRPSGWQPPNGVPVFRRSSEPKMATPATVERLVRRGSVPVLGITLSESFFDPHAPWVISSHGSIRGNHAVICVGLGRGHGNRIFLVRNSWGTDWGDAGYAWLDEGFLAQHLKEILLLTHEITL